MKKLIAILLLFTMAASAAACSSDTPGTADTETSANTTASETTTAETLDPNSREGAVSNIEKMDLGGMTINVGYIDASLYRTDIVGADDGDVINEAIYNRNLAVEEKLGIKYNPIALSTSTTEAGSKFKNTVLSGDSAYDLNTGHQSVLSKMLFDGLYYNIADDEYISYDSPWWAYDYMKEFGIGEDRIYFLFGDITLGMLKSAGCVYVNKPLFEDYYIPTDELYEMVFDGKWTLDQMYEYTSGAYTDLNGNGITDEGDLYGMASTTGKSVEHFQYDAGVRTTQRDSDGVPELILNNERTVAFAEKFYQLYHNNPGAKIFTVDSAINAEIREMFKNNELMFNPNWFYTVEYLRDMESDFGIIPYPKLDEMQEEYMTLVHNGTTMFTVPVTITNEKVEIIGAVLEEMAFEAYKNVTPAYFEVALKEKYSRDNTSSQMLDMIQQSLYTDFGYCYSGVLNNIGTLRELAKLQTTDFSSWYAKKENGAITALEELIALYIE